MSSLNRGLQKPHSCRLRGAGHLSILPVNQGIEHSAGASFAPNSQYFDPENIVKLAIEGGCNAVASTFGALGTVARKYAHKIPFIVKINHNELLTLPDKFDQVVFRQLKVGDRKVRRTGCPSAYIKCHVMIVDPQLSESGQPMPLASAHWK